MKECEQLWLSEKDNIITNLTDLLGNNQRFNKRFITMIKIDILNVNILIKILFLSER